MFYDKDFLRDIQSLINDWRYWFDFCPKLLFYLVEVKAVFVGDEVYGQA